MSELKRGVLFVYSGPSGVGKGTLKDMLIQEFGDQIAFSVSATTRQPREGEVNGKDYFFITKQEFDCLVENNQLLEHAQYAGNCYGTPREYVERLLGQGKNVLLEIEVQGAAQVMRNAPDCASVFILPPSTEELERRLRARGTESEEKVLARLEAAKRELPLAKNYQEQIVNDDLDTAYAQLRDFYLMKTKQA